MKTVSRADADPTPSAASDGPGGAQRVLIWVALRSHYRDMFRTAHLLLRDPRKEPWLVFARWYADVEEDLAACRADGIAYVGYCPLSNVPAVFDARAAAEVNHAHEAPDSKNRAAPAVPEEARATRHTRVLSEVVIEDDPCPPAPSPTGWRDSLRRFLTQAFKRLVPWGAQNVVRDACGYGVRQIFLGLPRLVIKCVLPHSVRHGLRVGLKFGRARLAELRWVARMIELLLKMLVVGRPASLAHWAQLLRFPQFWRDHNYARRYWWFRLREVEDQLDRIRPALIILPEDNVEYPTSALVSAGHRRGIPSVILPYTIGNKCEAAESNLYSPGHQAGTLYNRLLCARFPRWRHEHAGRALVRVPSAEALVLEELGHVPPSPWTLHSGSADLIALESPAALERALTDGLPRERLAVVGSPRLDDLAHYCRWTPWRRAALLHRLGLPDRPVLILCALPPDQGPSSRPGCEFNDYVDLARFFLRTLSGQPNCNVLVNPHPRCAKELIEALSGPRVRVVTGDIAGLIPLCDLYVASMSATISMALACGKPVINYDVYRYGYDDFAASDRVDQVVTREQFEQSLTRLLSALPATAPSTTWGVIDGQAGRRLLALFDRLIAGLGPAAEGANRPSPASDPKRGRRTHTVPVAA